MSRVVLDASVLLAVLNGEPGAEKMTPQIMSAAAASTVNVAEVHGKLVQRGISSDDAWTATSGVIDEAVAFSADQAKTAGDLVGQTRPLGLSLGDRACLALGVTLRSPIYSADKSWKKVHVGVPIHIIR